MYKESSNEFLLIDTHYVVYNRIYATKWKIGKNYPEIARTISDNLPGGPIECQEFMNEFERDVRECIKYMTRGFDYNRVIFLVDCFPHNVWRRKLYSDYKRSKREYDGFNCAPIIEWFHRNILNYWSKLGSSIFLNSELEADDLAYFFVDTLNEFNVKPGKQRFKVTIITGDNDYIQLLRYKNVTLKRVWSQPFRMPPRLEDCQDFSNDVRRIMYEHFSDPHRSLLTKIIRGDRSDNIPPAFECDNATLIRLFDDVNYVTEKLETPDIKNAFERNKKLIDMREIPKELAIDEIKRMNFLFERFM